MINNSGGNSVAMDIDNLETPMCGACGGEEHEEELQLLRNQCARCGQTGHWKNECPHSEAEAAKLKAQVKGGGKKGQGKGKGDRVCYKCGGHGHIAANCPSQ
eukprot:12325520-Karenia_brevis.AAC.1